MTTLEFQNTYQQEFDRQIDNLIQKKYPEAAGISKDEFLQYVEPLRKRLPQSGKFEIDVDKGALSFVIVIKNELVISEKAMSLVEKNKKQGVTILRPHTTQDFKTIEEVAIPIGMAYLLFDIDRGKETINLPPNKALKIIHKAKRSPLTIDDGVAIVTHFPDFLIKNNCFSLLGSRTGRNQCVPAIWINSKKEPNLGWCWDGNPHTWLGSASAIGRIGV